MSGKDRSSSSRREESMKISLVSPYPDITN
jgi:hypothetical protein